MLPPLVPAHLFALLLPLSPHFGPTFRCSGLECMGFLVIAALLFLVVPMVIGMFGVGILSWCLETVHSSGTLLPTGQIWFTALALIVLGGTLAQHNLRLAALSLLGIGVLSWCVVSLRARSQAAQAHRTVPILLALAYLALVAVLTNDLVLIIIPGLMGASAVAGRSPKTATVLGVIGLMLGICAKLLLG